MLAVANDEYGQFEWYSKASKVDIQKSQKMLKEYCELKIVVEDFAKYELELRQTIYEGEMSRRIDQNDLYANKTANAVIIAQNQVRAALECKILKQTIERAVNLIVDSEQKKAITLRYLQGYSYSETLTFMNRGVKSSTMDRRLNDGLESVANTLKMWGVLK